MGEYNGRVACTIVRDTMYQQHSVMAMVGWLRGAISLPGQHHIPEFVVLNNTITIRIYMVQNFKYMFLNKRYTVQVVAVNRGSIAQHTMVVVVYTSSGNESNGSR